MSRFEGDLCGGLLAGLPGLSVVRPRSGSSLRGALDVFGGAGEVLVRVRAAGINPGENAIRIGVFQEIWPATFPSGQGSDLAAVVEEVGPGVPTWSVGDEVIGWVDTRASHAELVVVPAEHLVRRDPAASWAAGGALSSPGRPRRRSAPARARRSSSLAPPAGSDRLPSSSRRELVRR